MPIEEERGGRGEGKDKERKRDVEGRRGRRDDRKEVERKMQIEGDIELEKKGRVLRCVRCVGG